jgi:hypothetical protein
LCLYDTVDIGVLHTCRSDLVLELKTWRTKFGLVYLCQAHFYEAIKLQTDIKTVLNDLNLCAISVVCECPIDPVTGFLGHSKYK